MRAVAILISGRVHGVGFRDWTRQQALALGVSGWVRNRRDSRVEVLASGDDDALARLVEALHQGPPLARVERIEQSPGAPVSGSGFEVRPTV